MKKIYIFCHDLYKVEEKESDVAKHGTNLNNVKRLPNSRLAHITFVSSNSIILK